VSILRWFVCLGSLGAALVARAQEPAPDELRTRLTEREDENRVPDPWSALLWGYPLTLAGEVETAFDYVEQQAFGEPESRFDRLFWQEGVQLESFYTRGEIFSLFAQASLLADYDIEGKVGDRVREIYVERGEMWLYSENLAGTGIGFELGRLEFEDERRWWWDDELDAARVSYERDRFEIALAVAREIAPRRSDRSDVDPEHDRVLRLIAELSWDWSPQHSIEAFALHQGDRSGSERVGSLVRPHREDDSDARLTWLGLRAMGGWSLHSDAIVGYWLDTGFVDGDEWLARFENAAPNWSRVESAERRSVRGWAIDAGVNWILPWAFEPRVHASGAYGSGDRHSETGSDHSYRQSGIHANETAFGGVQRFRQYGNLLDPELSNLVVVSLGVGIALLTESSIDLVYHHYRLVEPASKLRDARFEPTLDELHRELGDEVDLVLAFEEWKHLELEISASAFRAGSAFAFDSGKWTFGGYFAMRIAF
jgi:hypothetical protein